MSNIKVAIINASTTLTDAEVQAAVPALQAQVRDDFAPAWGIDADLSFVGTGGQPAPGAWWLAIMDNSDQQDALGYHETTNEGLPMGKVFAASDQQDGLNWTVTASHELLEMLADPEIDLTVFAQPSDTSGRLYAYEVCDPCEADQYGYEISGTLVSDFVFPAFFESFRKQGTPFDRQGQIKSPFELLPGGYIGIFDVTAGTGWSQQTAQKRSGRGFRSPRARVGSRRERRRVARDAWRKSTVQFGHKSGKKAA